MITKCTFGFHDFLEIEELNVYDESNPHASKGQLEVCYARQCKKCAKIQVKSQCIYALCWHDIKGFITEEKNHITQDDDVAKIAAVVDVGTPIVSKL